MAITKIHPIKTTLSLSIDYICDPAKTDEAILISSYKCGHITAALQFENTKEIMNSQCKNLARHLIQSFIPHEVTPTLAHAIGQELCEKHLKGKYEYVMTTHIDKGHIHNHIIFNNVSFIDGKAYISNKKSYHQIRNESDQICKSNGLSIINGDNLQSNNKTKGKSYKEYQEQNSGNSYKAKLKYTIDLAIKKAKDWDEFIVLMQEYGYEIKHGKHVSFKAIDQERFTRAKTIGSDYSEDCIKERIDNRQSGKLNHGTKQRTPIKVVDITSNQLASESAGFARWLKLQNLKNMAKTWQSINQNDIDDINAFYSHVAKVHDEFLKIQGDLKNVEQEILKTADRIKNINTYKKYKSIFTSYQNSTDKDAYLSMHESKIILFEAAREALESENHKQSLEPISTLEIRIKELTDESEKLMTVLDGHKKKLSEANQLKRNFEIYLRAPNQMSKSHLDVNDY
jgi:hypothetical protein